MVEKTEMSIFEEPLCGLKGNYYPPQEIDVMDCVFALAEVYAPIKDRKGFSCLTPNARKNKIGAVMGRWRIRLD